MKLTSLALLLPMTIQLAQAPEPVTVEVDARQWGAFATIARPAGARPGMTLEEGWLLPGFFEMWQCDRIDDGDTMAPGVYRFDVEHCTGRRITIKQRLGQGLRSTVKSWTLLDGCPAELEIAAVDETSGRLTVKRLVLIAEDVAVAR